MLDGNENWTVFRRELDALGVRIQFNWQARRDGKPAKYPKQCADIAQVCFVGNGFQPAILTALVIDYGKRDGFGLFVDSNSLSMRADAEAIAGRKVA